MMMNNQSSANKEHNESLITELRACDVLLGRGTGPNENHGNKRFRAILGKHKDNYLSTRTRDAKKKIVWRAICDVKMNNGRFVEKVGSVKNRSLYKEVKDSVAFLKTRQAFRYVLKTSVQDDPLAETDEAPAPESTRNLMNYLQATSPQPSAGFLTGLRVRQSSQSQDELLRYVASARERDARRLSFPLELSSFNFLSALSQNPSIFRSPSLASTCSPWAQSKPGGALIGGGTGMRLFSGAIPDVPSPLENLAIETMATRLALGNIIGLPQAPDLYVDSRSRGPSANINMKNLGRRFFSDSTRGTSGNGKNMIGE